MGGNEELVGPDLALGVERADVGTNGLLAGHAFGEPVLLARAGDDWFAVGGKCTHYSANLAEGLLVGKTVRCPWHHACFDLRTGAAVCAPALNDLPVYELEIKNGKVRVTGEKSAEPATGSSASDSAPRAPARVTVTSSSVDAGDAVVIVGAGAAGHACAEMLRRHSFAGSITIVDPDRDAPYDRPNLSKDYLAGSAPEEWLPLHLPKFYEEHGIVLELGVEVMSIDTKAGLVRLSDGRDLSYSKLLLATGASPIRLDIPGGDNILYFRSLADCRALLAKSKSAKRAIVIGASFIGLEVAASLRARGLEVTVVAPEKVPLEKVMGPELGETVKAEHEQRGVKFKLGRTVTALRGTTATLDDGSTLEADLVVAGIGVRPNLQLAEQAGLAVDKGVVVNGFLETSVPNVFAAGDIARWPDVRSGAPLRVEHWVVAERQGQTVARNIVGKRERFDDVPFFWSAHFDSLTINYSGHAEKWDEISVDGDLTAKDAAVSFVANGKTLAMATINRDLQNLHMEEKLEAEAT